MGRGRGGGGEAGPDGLAVIDKPGGWTSHDVVAKVRRILGTRKVGHAGTLDPMATGVLVLGVGRATRLLGHLALTDKTYEATIRLGVTTTTDDAEGEVVATSPTIGRTRRDVGGETPAASSTATAGSGRDDERGLPTAEDHAVDIGTTRVLAAMAALTGEIDQIPSSVSAVKVGGVRAYARVRAGEQVQLAARRVTVSAFELRGRRDSVSGEPDDLGDDLDVVVSCSSGTYVRALARDLGVALGCGAHLVALRRTRVGSFHGSAARDLDAMAAAGTSGLIGLADAVAASFPRRDVDAAQARDVTFGRRIPAVGTPGTYGVFAPDGTVLALAEEQKHRQAMHYLVVFSPHHQDTAE